MNVYHHTFQLQLPTGTVIIALLVGFIFWYRIVISGKRWDHTTTKYSSTEKPGTNTGSTDVIIVGAGVAGSALAYALAKDGRRVHVIERDLSEPDRFVGEFLQQGGYLKLIELGLQDCLEGIEAQKVFGIAFHADGKHSKAPYPLVKSPADIYARSFHNGRFVQKMRAKIASLSNVKLEQATVTSLVEENGIVKGVRYKSFMDGEEETRTAYAPLTIVCDGCFSNLRRSLCNPKVDAPSSFVCLALENNSTIPYESAHHLHYVLGDPLVGFYPISDTEIRCLVDMPATRKLPSIATGEMATYLKTFVASQIPPEFVDSFVAAVDKGKIRMAQVKSMPADPRPTPGAFIVGDAFNMRHPVTGAGMTVALSDVVLLRDLLRPLHDLTDTQIVSKYLEPFYILRKPMASTINTLADGFYKILCPSPEQTNIQMRNACFEYMSLGGSRSQGLVALLAALNPRPLSLLFHLVSLIIFGVGRLMIPFPSPGRLWLGARMISGAFVMVFPILKSEGIRQMFFPMTVPAYYRAPRLST